MTLARPTQKLVSILGELGFQGFISISLKEERSVLIKTKKRDKYFKNKMFCFQYILTINNICFGFLIFGLI